MTNQQRRRQMVNRLNAKYPTTTYEGRMNAFVDGIETVVEITVKVCHENGPDGRTWMVEDWSGETECGNPVEITYDDAYRVAYNNIM